jgi:hypothetical protein
MILSYSKIDLLFQIAIQQTVAGSEESAPVPMPSDRSAGARLPATRPATASDDKPTRPVCPSASSKRMLPLADDDFQDF